MDYKITQEEIEKNWVQSAPDQLRSNDSTVQDNKKIFDKLPLLICEKHNTLSEYVKTNIYSKEETIQKINERVVEIGAGDMAQKVYDENNDGVVNAADNGIFEYTHSGDTLTGSGINGKFKATSAGNKASFTINGKSYSVKQGEEASVELVAGVWYTFILDKDDNTINFTRGGAAYPFGATVKPVNNIKIWQKCALLEVKYDNISDILKDTDTLKTLIYNSNAMDYLSRSTILQESILNSPSAIAILDSSLPYQTPDMTGTNTPEGTVNVDGKTPTKNEWALFSNGTEGGIPDGSYCEYALAPYWQGKWFYKARVKVRYSLGGTQYKLQGVKMDGSIIDLTDVINSTATTGTPDERIITLKPYDGRLKAVRIYSIFRVGYTTRIKFWGK